MPPFTEQDEDDFDMRLDMVASSLRAMWHVRCREIIKQGRLDLRAALQRELDKTHSDKPQALRNAIVNIMFRTELITKLESKCEPAAQPEYIYMFGQADAAWFDALAQSFFVSSGILDDCFKIVARVEGGSTLGGIDDEVVAAIGSGPTSLPPSQA